METINDVRREEGNPNAGQPNTGPVPVNRAFHNPGAGMRLTATVLLVLAALTTVLGIVTFIIPLTIIGIGGLIVGAFMFARARSRVLHA